MADAEWRSRLAAPDCSILTRPIRLSRITDAILSFSLVPFFLSSNADPIGNRAVPDQPSLPSLTTNTSFPHPLSPSFFHLPHPSISTYHFFIKVHQPQWPEPSRQPVSYPPSILNTYFHIFDTNYFQVSPLVARPPVSSSPPRLPARPPLRPVVSRSLTATSLVSSIDDLMEYHDANSKKVPSLSVRSVATRSPLSS